MSTNCKIAVVNEDGTVTAIWCHWDGYLDHCGPTLQEHYKNPTKIQELMSHGNLDSLGPEIGVQYDQPGLREKLFSGPAKFFSSKLDKFMKTQCTFYIRDMKQPDNLAETHESLSAFEACGESYNYVFMDGEWWTDAFDDDAPGMTGTWVTVERALESSEEGW